MLTGLPFIQGRTIYEWYRLFGVFSKEEIAWKNAFLISSAAFIDRIETEEKAVGFVSDGAVFTELMYLKLTKKILASRARSEQDKIMAGLENVCLRHAARSYDCVIHIDTPIADERETFEKMFESGNIPYRIYGSDNPAETLEQILSQLDLPAKISVENALYLAEKNIYIDTL